MARHSKTKKRCCFSKKLLIADYAILLFLIFIFMWLSVKDCSTADCAIVIGEWIVQLGVSSAAYYWKAKAENLVKLPIYMLKEIPADMKDKADPNQIIASIISLGQNN